MVLRGYNLLGRTEFLLENTAGFRKETSLLHICFLQIPAGLSALSTWLILVTHCRTFLDVYTALVCHLIAYIYVQFNCHARYRVW